LSSNTRIPHLMSCLIMSIDESLIYLIVSWVIQNVHFRHFGELKMIFLIIRQRVLLSFGYTCVGISNICKYYLFLNVTSESSCSYTGMPHLMPCIGMSNDESFIYVLVSWVFHNVHFRNFTGLKMRFLIIRQRVLYKHV